MKKISLFLAFLAVTSGPAMALSGKVIGINGSDVVFVWKDKQSQTEAMSLIDAGVHKSNPALLMQLLACVVDSGTAAIITDAGFATHDIMVTEGPDSGCRGNIPMESWD